MPYRDYLLTVLQPDQISLLESRLQPDQAFPVVCRSPGRYPTGSSRDSWMPYRDYLLKTHPAQSTKRV